MTIACVNCGDGETPAAHINFYGSRIHDADHTEPVCADCASLFVKMSGHWEEWDFVLPLINPGTCTDSDIANVRAALEAMCRLLVAACTEGEEHDVLVLCAQEVRGTLYERCPPSVHGAIGKSCVICNGTGWVLVRREVAA